MFNIQIGYYTVIVCLLVFFCLLLYKQSETRHDSAQESVWVNLIYAYLKMNTTMKK